MSMSFKAEVIVVERADSILLEFHQERFGTSGTKRCYASVVVHEASTISGLRSALIAMEATHA